MIRLARRPLPFIVFSWLLSAATAFAECAWVMWLNAFHEGSGVEIRSVESAHATRQECDEAIHVKATVLKKKDHDVVGGFPGSYEVMGTKGQTTRRYYCLPDTIDPRGAKGGG